MAAKTSSTKKTAPAKAKATPKKTEGTALEKTKTGTAVATTFESMQGAGLENVSASDLIIPRLGILHHQSPQVLEDNAAYIKGAKPGMICDVGLAQLMPATIVFIPCFYAKVYLEWAPRTSGKGLVRNHGIDPTIMKSTKLDDKNRNVLPNKNYIAETATYFGINVSAGNRRSFIPMTSTNMKVARRWTSRIEGEKLTGGNGKEFTPPIFYRGWELSSVAQSNNDGNWFIWTVEPGPGILDIDSSEELLGLAKQFYEQAKSGLVRGDVSSLDETEASRPAADGDM